MIAETELAVLMPFRRSVGFDVVEDQFNKGGADALIMMQDEALKELYRSIEKASSKLLPTEEIIFLNKLQKAAKPGIERYVSWDFNHYLTWLQAQPTPPEQMDFVNISKAIRAQGLILISELLEKRLQESLLETPGIRPLVKLDIVTYDEDGKKRLMPVIIDETPAPQPEKRTVTEKKPETKKGGRKEDPRKNFKEFFINANDVEPVTKALIAAGLVKVQTTGEETIYSTPKHNAANWRQAVAALVNLRFIPKTNRAFRLSVEKEFNNGQNFCEEKVFQNVYGYHYEKNSRVSTHISKADFSYFKRFLIPHLPPERRKEIDINPINP